MFFLKFLFFIFLCGLFLLLFVVLGFVGVFRRARMAFHKEYEEVTRQQEHYEDQEVVIDPRNADERSRKIISEDEGEYVDYVNETEDL